MSELKRKYKEEIVPYFLSNKLVKNIMEVPFIEKVVLNVGFGKLGKDKDFVELYRRTVSLISGQFSVFTKAKKSISNFKLRQGDVVGCKVTLRCDKMYDFLEKLLFVSLPRIRDFRGLRRSSFDGRGNFSIGIDDLSIFPEIEYEKLTDLKGLDITVVTTAKNDDYGVFLLELLGFPFKIK